MAFTDTDTAVGGSTAISYATVSQLNTYASRQADRYPGIPALSDTLKESALIRGTAFVDGLSTDRASDYAKFFPGTRTSSTQNLKWPRASAYRTDGTEIDSTTIPFAIIQATCEAACFEATNVGQLQEIIKLSEVVRSVDAGVKVNFQPTQFIIQARNCLTLVEDYISDIIRMPKGRSNFFVIAFDSKDYDGE